MTEALSSTRLGILPDRFDQLGPLQEAEQFAALQGALEDARGEYDLRRLDATERILGSLVPRLKNRDASTKYALLLASALCLRGRLLWRRGEKAKEIGLPAEELRRLKDGEQRSFRESVDYFRRNEKAIEEQPSRSRLFTDYAIALFRTEQIPDSVGILEKARLTGAVPAEAFGYLGLAYARIGKLKQAVDALEKGCNLRRGTRCCSLHWPEHSTMRLETTVPGVLGCRARMIQMLDVASRLFNTEVHGRDDDSIAAKAVHAYCLAAAAARKDNDLTEARSLLEAALELRRDDPQALSMLTQLLLSQGKDQDAKELLDRTLDEFPDHKWALGLKAILLRDRGEIDQAVATFRKVRVDSPDLAWVFLELAKTLAPRDQQEARRVVEQAARLLAHTSSALALASAEVAAHSNSDEAIAFLKQVIDIDTHTLATREELARLLIGRNELATAMDVIDEALNIAPNSAQLLSMKADILERQGEHEEAIRWYRRAVRAAPEDDNIFLELIDAERATGRIADAFEDLDLRIARSPKNAVAHAQKGFLLVECNKLDEGVTALRKAAELDPGVLRVQLELGETLRRLDCYEEAEEVFNGALLIDNDIFDAHAFQAFLLNDIAEFNEASRLLEQAIAKLSAKEPKNEPTRARLGLLHTALASALECSGGGVLLKMEEVLRRRLEDNLRSAIEYTPADPWAKKNFGELLLYTKRRREGEKLLEEFVRNPGADAPVSLVGFGHYLLRQYDEAIRCLRVAVSANSDDIGAHFDLALAYLAAKRSVGVEEYRRTIEQAASKHPNRQHGLLYVATIGLVQAAADGRLVNDEGRNIFTLLHNRLKETGFQRTAVLVYPAAVQTG